MSQFWTGYYGTGLMLSQNEFIEMLKKYVKENIRRGNRVCDLEEINAYVYDGEAEFYVNEYDFIRSDGSGSFYVSEYTSDTYEGFFFSPFFVNGKANVTYKDENGDWQESIDEFIEIEYDPVYLIFSDKDFISPMVFTEKPYDSYKDFKDEFRCKIGTYLPEDFDWDSHLGSFRCACFA